MYEYNDRKWNQKNMEDILQTNRYIYVVSWNTTVKQENNEISQPVQRYHDPYGWKKIVKYIKTGYYLFLGS
jgi:hypothetical protein